MIEELINRKIVTYHKFKSKNNLRLHLKKFEKNKVLVTVDDGDVSFYQHFFPLLKEYNIKVILFIVTELIDSDKPFWWDEIRYLLGADEGEKKAWEVKKWPNKERLKYLENLRSQTPKPPLKQIQLTSAQLLEMAAAGVVIANHSHTHPIFDQCTEDEIRDEFKSSKKFFENIGINGYHIFAYPNGSFNAIAEEIAKQEGIKYAYLFDHKLNFKAINPLQISRLSIGDSTSLFKLNLILSGIHSKFLPLRKKVYNLFNG